VISSRIPADKTLVSTDKSYKLIGISQKKKMLHAITFKTLIHILPGLYATIDSS
jgi:hypothetical protein